MLTWRTSFASLESHQHKKGNPRESEIHAVGIIYGRVGYVGTTFQTTTFLSLATAETNLSGLRIGAGAEIMVADKIDNISNISVRAEYTNTVYDDPFSQTLYSIGVNFYF